MIGKQVVETIKLEDAVKKTSKMLRYNSNKPNTDSNPKQDGKTVALVFNITINEKTCKHIVSMGGINEYEDKQPRTDSECA